MERHRRNFKKDPNKQKSRAGKKKRGRFSNGCNLRQIHLSGGTIDQCNSIEKKSCRERPEKKILQSRFGTKLFILEEARHHIETDRHGLQADKQRDKVIGCEIGRASCRERG